MRRYSVNNRAKREGDVPWIKESDALSRGIRFSSADHADDARFEEKGRPISLLSSSNVDRIEAQVLEFINIATRSGAHPDQSGEKSPFIYGDSFSANSLHHIQLPQRFSISRELQKPYAVNVKRGDCWLGISNHISMYMEMKDAFLEEIKSLKESDNNLFLLEENAAKKMSLVSSAIQTFSSFSLNQRFGDGREKSGSIAPDTMAEYVTLMKENLAAIGIRSIADAERVVLPHMAMEYGKGVGGTFYCPKSLPAHLSVATMLSGIAGLKLYTKNLSFADFNERWRFKDFGPFCSTPGARLQSHGKHAPYGYIDPDQIHQLGSVTFCIARKRAISASSKACHAMNRVAAKMLFMGQKRMKWWVENTKDMENRASSLLQQGWVPFSSDFSQFDKSQNASVILPVMKELLPAWQYELFLFEFYADWIAPSVHPEYSGRIISSDPKDPASGFLNTGQSFTTVCNINTAVLVMATAIRKIFGYTLRDVGKKWHMFNLGDDIVIWLKTQDASKSEDIFASIKEFGFEISVDPGFIFLMKTLTKDNKLTNLMARSITSIFEPEAQRPNALVNTLAIAAHHELLRYHPKFKWFCTHMNSKVLSRLPLTLFDTIEECAAYVNSKQCIDDLNAYASSSIEARLSIEKIILAFSSGVAEDSAFESAGLRAMYGVLTELPAMAVRERSLDNKALLQLFEDHQTWLEGGALSPKYAQLIKNAEAALNASGGQGVIDILA